MFLFYITARKKFKFKTFIVIPIIAFMFEVVCIFYFYFFFFLLIENIFHFHLKIDLRILARKLVQQLIGSPSEFKLGTYDSRKPDILYIINLL